MSDGWLDCGLSRTVRHFVRILIGWIMVHSNLDWLNSGSQSKRRSLRSGVSREIEGTKSETRTTKNQKQQLASSETARKQSGNSQLPGDLQLRASRQSATNRQRGKEQTAKHTLPQRAHGLLHIAHCGQDRVNSRKQLTANSQQRSEEGQERLEESCETTRDVVQRRMWCSRGFWQSSRKRNGAAIFARLVWREG
mgnify:CR=1 FL=1